MAERAASPDTRYRVVCYELQGEHEQVVIDATGDGFIAATGVISTGRLRGELLSAGAEELQAHLALQIASDDQLAGFIAGRRGGTGSGSKRAPSGDRPTVRGRIANEGEEMRMSELSDAVSMTQDEGRGAPAGVGVVVQIKVKLRGVQKPPVWRRLQVRADTPLDRLHEAIVAAFGWAGYHMHVFRNGPEEFGVSDPELGFIDERRVSLGHLIGGVGDQLLYTYDFGDDWEHEITVEELLDPDPEVHYPLLLAAKGACPPEDCGGPWGYAELKEILADPAHDRHPEMLDWLGLDDASAFDPHGFDADEIEEELALSGAGR